MKRRQRGRYERWLHKLQMIFPRSFASSCLIACSLVFVYDGTSGHSYKFKFLC